MRSMRASGEGAGGQWNLVYEPAKRCAHRSPLYDEGEPSCIQGILKWVDEIPRGFPLLRGPVIEVGPQHDLTPTLNTLAQLQNFFHAQTMHEFHEEAKTYLQQIYSDFDHLVDQVRQIGVHEKYLDERSKEIATFAFNLGNETVSFAKEC